jgi:eukaryotic-like serine/threonine-protein kinase
VLEPLGAGGAGVVYRATDGERDVALKVLRDPDPVAQARLAREARIAAEIESRHLVRILEVGDDWLAMPLYPSSLAAILPLTVPGTVKMAAQLAQALDALHARGLVHRDVKPSNVLLDDAGDAVLTDFGLARGADSTQLTRDGQIVGTLHYLAPELIEGDPASPASDIYALGCLLYACVTGAPPFTGTEAELAYAHLAEPPPKPAGVPDDLVLALLTALEKEPAARPTTGTALARMLHLAGTTEPS